MHPGDQLSPGIYVVIAAVLEVRGHTIPEYLFYTIRKDGHIAGPPTNIEMSDDLSAVREARRLQDGLDIQIWQGQRVVAYLVADKQ